MKRNEKVNKEKKVIKLPTEYVTHLELPNGEKYDLKGKLTTADIMHINKIWEKVNREEIAQLISQAKLEVFDYLKKQGYEFLIQERIKLL